MLVAGTRRIHTTRTLNITSPVLGGRVYRPEVARAAMLGIGIHDRGLAASDADADAAKGTAIKCLSHHYCLGISVGPLPSLLLFPVRGVAIVCCNAGAGRRRWLFGNLTSDDGPSSSDADDAVCSPGGRSRRVGVLKKLASFRLVRWSVPLIGCSHHNFRLVGSQPANETSTESSPKRNHHIRFPFFSSLYIHEHY